MQNFEHFAKAARMEFEQRRLGFFHGMQVRVYIRDGDVCRCSIGAGLNRTQIGAIVRKNLLTAPVRTLVDEKIISFESHLVKQERALDFIQSAHDFICCAAQHEDSYLLESSLRKFLFIVNKTMDDNSFAKTINLIKKSYTEEGKEHAKL